MLLSLFRTSESVLDPIMYVLCLLHFSQTGCENQYIIYSKKWIFFILFYWTCELENLKIGLLELQTILSENLTRFACYNDTNRRDMYQRCETISIWFVCIEIDCDPNTIAVYRLSFWHWWIIRVELWY